MPRRLVLTIISALLLAACSGDQSETAAGTREPIDCATADTSGLSMFVKDPFQRDLAIDTPTRITQHLDETPTLICLTLHSSHGELPVIAYATAHRPDAAMIFPLLIERGANAEDALPVAVYLGKTRALPWLLENGVDPNSGDALIIAAAERRTRIVQLLLAAGADPNRKSSVGPFVPERGTTALHRAAHHGVREMIEALIGAGASVNALDALGRPPLHEAVVSQDAGTIRLLYEWGAVPSLLAPQELEALRGIARRYRMERMLAEIG